MNYYQSTVAEIVNDNPSTAVVFKKHKIDFCCKGNVPLKTACKNAGMEINLLIREIENTGSKASGLLRYASWSKETLIHFIIENHHQYLIYTLPQIVQFAERVAQVHGGENKKLIELFQVIHSLRQELMDHIKSEENQLFPQILKNDTISGDMMEKYTSEHSDAGRALEKIRELTDDFQTPDYACNTYRALFSLLEEFEADMHQHVHLENNVLFQKIQTPKSN